MIVILQTIHSFDVSLYYFLTGFAGNATLDRFASFEEGSSLLKGGFFMAMYWAVWFGPGPDQRKRRRSTLAVLAGALLALLASRTLADLAPYRLRPMFDPQVQHHAYSFAISPRLVDWSSFPSDHAAFFFALAFGLAYLSRRLAIPLLLYVLGWICLPRLFLGIHWLSDIVTGAAIGIALAWAAIKVEELQSGLATRALAFADASPRVFYGLAFLVSFEMGVLFEDVRDIAKGVFKVLPLVVPELVPYARLITLGTLALLVIAVGLVFLGRRRRTVRERVAP